jgi:hypothetical protein
MAAGHQDHGALLKHLGDADSLILEAVPGVVPEQAQPGDAGLQVRHQLVEACAAQ